MQIQSIDSFLEYYLKVKQRTFKVLSVIPKEHRNWTYKEGKFTIADQIRHIAAIERYMFAEAVAGNSPCYKGCGVEYGETLDDVLLFFNKMHEESLEIYKNLKDEDLFKKCKTPGGTEISTWKWLRAMIEHEIHHRAQIYIYLNTLNINTPPIFGLTSEQVISLSNKE